MVSYGVKKYPPFTTCVGTFEPRSAPGRGGVNFGSLIPISYPWEAANPVEYFPLTELHWIHLGKHLKHLKWTPHAYLDRASL